MTRAPRVAVVGAGVAGLAAAHRLHRLRPDAEVVVFDAAGRTGGKVLTTEFAGLPVDEAADAFLARSEVAVALCRELGLADRLVTPAARRAFLWRRGELRRLPESTVLGVPTDLDELGRCGLVSAAALARAEADLARRVDDGAPADGRDESVGGLVRRRLGDEIFEVLVAPLLSGVNAGDADHLSVEAGAAQLAAAARADASLIRGARGQREAARAANPDPDAPVFYGLRGGTQQLTDALAASLPAGAMRLATPVAAVEPTADGGRRLALGHPDGAVDHVAVDGLVLATPSYVTAELVREHMEPGPVAELADLAWASVAMVTLAVPRSAVAHPLDGSGFLVVDRDDLDVLTACSFGSSKWAHWAHDDVVILRASAGRSGDERALGLHDDELVARIVGDLATTIGLDGNPLAARVSRWERSLPQYRPGHLDRVRRWRTAVREAFGATELAGASLEGLGLPACIASGEDAARSVARQLPTAS